MSESEEPCPSTVYTRIPSHVSKYKVIKIIGRGGFAVVVLAQHTITKETVAIKIINRDIIVKNNLLMYLENELRLSTRFNHPNIAKVYDVIYEEDIIMIIMEYLQNGDLQSLLSRGVYFTIKEQLNIATQVLSGLAYLHSRGISHRDVKPENIMFDAHYNPKLIDFGLSKENGSVLKTYCGTPHFMAPEIILSQNYNGMKADLWAYGVTVHIMATGGRFPYTSQNDMQILEQIRENKLELQIEPKGLIGAIIEKALTIPMEERPTSADLLAFIEEKRCTNKAISTYTFNQKDIVDTPLPKLAPRNTTPLFIRAQNVNEKSSVLSSLITRVRAPHRLSY
ncbi:CAMK family protein kinase [Trichomonas vaginalis G3]|uniref:CAMK family protein kinase n=1 Tax=Trichomonas vaginalis (strain ATCC PRA-98 / G3) TaxID=412133 RepID=A2G1L2_TRIV3|nr:protein serine/threonine kinase protein [Trichomonas vaginalis G3]EAX88951.1 CAMK family protein kinase [Trichomonas vaginalis G3]KAI5507985.1 protein serine/threonine kinase protein [Trichomonas vaginalis G3]|eukprot:XP_001301881.1 CAMK family protein kinase [Trichomonas vaginalis G3]